MSPFGYAFLTTCFLGAWVVVAQHDNNSSCTALPSNCTIKVSSPVHQFGPDLITAAVGDVITFKFYQTTHSVVRAGEGDPCAPYENTNQGQKGFFSGMKTVGPNDINPTWTLRINDTHPIFFYCSAPGSCDQQRMIGGINMNQTALDHQKSLVNENTKVLQPGESIPPEETSTAEAGPQTHSGLSTGAIVGIAIGGAAVLGLAAALCFFVGRAKTLQEFLKRGETGGGGDASHQDVVHNPEFEGCVPVKGGQSSAVLPPAYSSPVVGGPMSTVHRHGEGGGSMLDYGFYRGPDIWRMSGYDGPPQEMDAREGVPRR